MARLRCVRAAALAVVAVLSVGVIPSAVGTSAGAASAKNSKGKAQGGGSPIKVGYIVTLTGSTAAAGQAEEAGFKLGLKKYGQKINGHPIKVIYRDAAATATLALSAAKALINSDHVNVMEGPIFSFQVGVVAPYAGSHGIPIDDLTLATIGQITVYKKYGMGLVSGWSLYQPSTVAGTYAYATLKWRHATVIGNDFGFGWESVGGFGAEFTKLGGTIEKSIFIPGNATDMSSYIAQIPKTTQGVYIELSGNQATTFINQYQSFGLKTKIPLVGLTTLTTAISLPADKKNAVTGTLTGSQYCTGIPSKRNTTFARASHNASGQWPSYYSEGAFVKAEVLVTALKKVNGNVSNPKQLKALGKAMREVRVTAPRGQVKFTRSVNSVVENQYICKVQTVNGTLRNVPIKTYKNVPPSGLLSRSTWMKQFAQQSKGRPSF